MRIDNTNTLQSLNSINRAGKTKSHALNQLSTGVRNSNAANNAAAYAIIQRTYGNIGGVEQSYQNTQNSNAMLATAAGGTENVVSNLSSLRETLLNAANSTNSDSDLRTLRKTAEQTIASINDTASSTTYNGMQLLQNGKNAVVAGLDGYENVGIQSMSAQSLGLTDGNGASKLDFSSASGISNSLDLVDKALNTALDQATTLGAQQQALSYRADNYMTQQEGLTGQAQTMDSTDMAKAATQFRSADIQQQLALYATNMNNHNRSAVLSLLH